MAQNNFRDYLIANKNFLLASKLANKIANKLGFYRKNWKTLEI